MNTPSEFDIIRERKEKLCYVSKTVYSTDMNGGPNLIDYSLSNGSAMTIGKELFKRDEVVFIPQ